MNRRSPKALMQREGEREISDVEKNPGFPCSTLCFESTVQRCTALLRATRPAVSRSYLEYNATILLVSMQLVTLQLTDIHE